ncbi:MAG: hypothetical protein GY696_12520, partial [Gammaproteobacteria bacterium]|nr:hypothetical protein [Gammaproteobacteria bacterium]
DPLNDLRRREDPLFPLETAGFRSTDLSDGRRPGTRGTFFSNSEGGVSHGERRFRVRTKVPAENEDSRGGWRPHGRRRSHGGWRSQPDGDPTMDDGDPTEDGDPRAMEIRRRTEIPRWSIPRGRGRFPRGRRRFPEEGDAQRIPERNAREWRSREEGDDSQDEGDDSQRTEMPKDSRGRGCLEEEDAQRKCMPGGQRFPQDVYGTLWIRPPAEEQMPDDDTLAPAPGLSGEAVGHGSRIDIDSKTCDTRYSEGGEGV